MQFKIKKAAISYNGVDYKIYPGLMGVVFCAIIQPVNKNTPTGPWRRPETI